MLEQLNGLPDGVVGVRAAGELRSADYRDVLLPAVERLAAQGKDVRIVLVFEEFGGMSAGAAWQDLRLGTEHFTRWKRIALVTDIDWMTRLVSLFGWMTPGEVKHFPLAERDQAVAWAAAGAD